MKWWYWLILELMIIFGVIALIYFIPGEIEDDFARGIIGFALICAIEDYKDINRRKTMDYKKGMTCGECLKYEFCPVANHNTNHKACMKITTKEYHTIEQNAGENRIEGGVVGIIGSVDTFRCWKCGRTLPISERTDFVYMSNPPKYTCKECEGIKKEKQYQSFKNCSELIDHCGTKNIWIKSKFDSNCVLQITGYSVDDEGYSVVWLTDSWITLEKLFDDFVFLDDSPIGVEI